MCDEKIWKFQIKELKKKYKVIFAKVKKGETIKEYSSNIIKSLPKKFSIIGFSMGGFIALDLSINHPERVEKLILVGTNGRSISDKRKKFLNKFCDEINNDNFINKFCNANINSYFSKNNQSNIQYLNLIKSMAKKLGYLVFKRQTNAILKRPSVLSKLSKIKLKCLIVSGSNDTLSTKEMNTELKKRIKNSELFFIKKSSHFVMFEQAKKFNNKILEWMEN